MTAIFIQPRPPGEYKTLRLAQPEKHCQSIDLKGFAASAGGGLAWAHVRILLDYRPALRARTGVGEYAHQLGSALARQLAPGDSLVLFSSSWKDRLSPGAIPGIAVVDARVPVTFLNLAWHRLEWPPIETFAADVDVVHSMHPLLLPTRRAAQVVTVHDLYFLDAPENTAAEIRRDYPALAGSHARRADAVVTVSEYTASQVRSRLDVKPDRIAICPSGAPAWTPRDPSSRGQHVLFMGTIEPRKNVATLLRAYAELIARQPSSPPLVLAGAVTSACRSLLDEIGRPPLAGRVRHVGYVSGDERERLYREAAIVVLPSYDEGFGLPALEAMTLGVPVIVSSRGALPEVVGTAGLVVDPDDVSGLSAAMARMLGDEAFARDCAARGVAEARRFSWDASAARLMEAYRSAIDRRRAR
jgi:glycosyltransferase involved in cell wall biosynthesis